MLVIKYSVIQQMTTYKMELYKIIQVWFQAA